MPYEDIENLQYLHKAYPSITKDDYVKFLAHQQKQHEEMKFTKKQCLKAGYFPCDKRIEFVNKYDMFTDAAKTQVNRDFKKSYDEIVKHKSPKM